MTSKILIGCPTYDGQKFCLDEFIDGIDALTNKDCDILFVDNSPSEFYLATLRKQKVGAHKVEIIRDTHKDSRISNIISSRNIVRDYFLKGDYSHLLFLDTDVIPPRNVISQLLECKSDIASGVYLCRVQINNTFHIIPTLYLPHKDGTVKTMRKQDVKNTIFDIAVCGMGCCLISRRALEKISFRPFSESKSGGEDVALCYDAQKLALSIKANGNIKCAHMGKNETLTF